MSYKTRRGLGSMQKSRGRLRGMYIIDEIRKFGIIYHLIIIMVIIITIMIIP